MPIKSEHPNTDFFEGYLLALESATHHLEIAESSKTINLGMANSHVILASEESLKAFVLLCIHHDLHFDDDVDDLHKYFSSHAYKHRVLHSLETISLMMGKLAEITISPFQGLDRESLEEQEKYQLRKEGHEKSMKWIDDFFNGKVKLETNKEWWRNANDMKNRGFYVDLERKSGKWSIPSKITEVQYHESYTIVSNLIAELIAMEERFANGEGLSAFFDIKGRIGEQLKPKS